MSESRRRFLTAGVMTALFAAFPLKSIFSQSWKDRDGNPGETPPVQSDPLSNYSKATFTSYLNSIFQLQTVAGIVAITLTKVDDMPAPKGGECFALLFRGGSRAWPQDSYMITHPSLGTFALLLVPAGSDANGAQGYLATINRLSPADFANMSAPSRSPRTAPPATSPNTSSPTTTTPPPVVTPVVTPTVTPVTPTVAPATPVPTHKPRKHRKRKPSWKTDDGQRFTLPR